MTQYDEFSDRALRHRDEVRKEQPASYYFYGLWHDMDLETQGIDEMLRATRQSRFREIPNPP